MNKNMFTQWTAIITNVAVVVGLVFVGLEFRNNSRSIEAERIDSFTQGVAGIQALWVGSDSLSDIVYKSHVEPEELSGSDLNRLQHLLFLYHHNFSGMHQAYQSGLISDEMYAVEKDAMGFYFSSKIGLDAIELMRESDISTGTWDNVYESAIKARAYCGDPNNKCAAMYDQYNSGRP